MAKNSIHIPEEILLEIFFKLPAKSVGKSRCLSKTWRTQLSTKHFINEHTKTQHQQKLIIVDKYPDSLYMFTLPFKENKTLRNINLGDQWTFVLGSCNGLVLLQSKAKDGNSVFAKYENNFFVFNPITREQVRIPDPGSVPYSGLSIYGFGYDTLSDDYKVVRTYWKDSTTDPIGYVSIDVYSLKTSVWKRNVKPSLEMSALYSENHFMPFVNGAVHWAEFDTDKIYHVQAFNLDSETVHDVELPSELKTIRSISLTVLKGCLSIVHQFNDLSVDIWMMKDYGMKESWVRFHFDVNVMGGRITPICFIGDEELLCFDERRWDRV